MSIRIVGGNILNQKGELDEAQYDQSAFLVLETPQGVFKISVGDGCEPGLDVVKLKQNTTLCRDGREMSAEELDLVESLLDLVESLLRSGEDLPEGWVRHNSMNALSAHYKDAQSGTESFHVPTVYIYNPGESKERVDKRGFTY